MADYQSLIARAVAALPQSTPDARRAVYERARKALFNQLRGIQPPVAQADIAAEGRALEEAIERVEAESAAKQAQAPQSGADASAPQRAARSIAGAKPAARAAAENEESKWRDTPYSSIASGGDVPSREYQRPPAPLPPAPKPKRSLRLTLSIAGVVVALVAIVGTLAWQLREQPEDLAKLKPERSASSAPENGKINDRVGGEGVAARPPSRSPSVPVAQKAEMWVGSLAEPTKVDKIYNGSVVWRLENVGGPGEPVGSAIRGDIDIPDAKLKMTLLFRKNTDAALSASHTINVSFTVAPGSAIGGVKAIGPIQMRRSDAQSGEKVVGIPVPITENNFLIGLMRGDHESRNILLLRSLSALDLPMQLADGRAATINMEKGPSGERVFADAIDAWGK
jgi:hypothetical protein